VIYSLIKIDKQQEELKENKDKIKEKKKKLDSKKQTTLWD